MFEPSLRTQCAGLGGINLGQGICDLPVPEVIKQQGYHAIKNNKNIYSPCEGILSLRQAISNKLPTLVLHMYH